jgi:hypothetical protein
MKKWIMDDEMKDLFSYQYCKSHQPRAQAQDSFLLLCAIHHVFFAAVANTLSFQVLPCQFFFHIAGDGESVIVDPSLRENQHRVYKRKDTGCLGFGTVLRTHANRHVSRSRDSMTAVDGIDRLFWHVPSTNECHCR